MQPSVEIERIVHIKYDDDTKGKGSWTVHASGLEVVSKVELVTLAKENRGCKRFFGDDSALLDMLKASRLQASRNAMVAPAPPEENLFDDSHGNSDYITHRAHFKSQR